MKKVLSQDQEKFLCFQYIDGKSMQKLASEWDIAVGTVFSILKRHGVSKPPSKR